MGREDRFRGAGRLPVIVASVLALSGCFGGGAKLPEGSLSESFESVAGPWPGGWRIEEGDWYVVHNETAPSPMHVFMATNAGTGLPLIVAPGGSYNDIKVSVKFAVAGGELSQTAGIVFHFRSPDDYDLIRYNRLEAHLHFLSYRGGDRIVVAVVDLNLALGSWHELSVEARQGDVKAYVDGLHRLSGRVEPGRTGGTGLRTTDDSLTLFDDFLAMPLG